MTHRVWKAAGALVALGALLMLPVGSQAGAAPAGRYIVQLADPPLASYRGAAGRQRSDAALIGKGKSLVA